jgi:hypothetical protein
MVADQCAQDNGFRVTGENAFHPIADVEFFEERMIAASPLLGKRQNTSNVRNEGAKQTAGLESPDVRFGSKAAFSIQTNSIWY